MVGYILFHLGLLLYFIGEGLTEGFTWANFDRRLKNRLIQHHWKGCGKGIFCYHSVRVCLENFGQLLFIFGLYIGTINLNFLFILSRIFIGVFIYERFFNYVVYNKIFPQKGNYKIFNLEIKQSPIYDILVFLTGILIVVFSG